MSTDAESLRGQDKLGISFLIIRITEKYQDIQFRCKPKSKYGGRKAEREDDIVPVRAANILSKNNTQY